MQGVLEALEKFIFVNEPTEADRSHCSVLIIDDDRILVDTLCGLLQDAGFNVLTSSTGHKGLITLHSTLQTIDVVILDYNMPHFDGEQALTYLRKLNPNVKVIGLTGMSNMQLPPGFRWEVDRLIEKPFNSTDLIQCLIEVVPGQDHEKKPVKPTPVQTPMPKDNISAPHIGKVKDKLADFIRYKLVTGKEAARIRLLARISPEKGDEVLRLLEDLVELRSSNVITQLEFESKKERILSE